MNGSVLSAPQGNKRNTFFQKKAQLNQQKKRKLMETPDSSIPDSSTSEDSLSESEDDKVILLFINFIYRLLYYLKELLLVPALFLEEIGAKQKDVLLQILFHIPMVETFVQGTCLVCFPDVRLPKTSHRQIICKFFLTFTYFRFLYCPEHFNEEHTEKLNIGFKFPASYSDGKR